MSCLIGTKSWAFVAIAGFKDYALFKYLNCQLGELVSG